MNTDIPAIPIVTDHVTPEIAAHVLWHFGRGGYQPGSFTEALLVAFARADIHNMLALRRGFPGYFEAMYLAQEHVHGIKHLQEIAGGKS